MDFSSLSEQSLRTSRLYLRAGSSLMIRTDHVGAKSPRHSSRSDQYGEVLVLYMEPGIYFPPGEAGSDYQ